MSPATGAEAEADAAVARQRAARKRRAAVAGPLDISLEHGRWRHLGWAVAGLAFGGVLVYKLGAVGKSIGVLFCAAALYSLWQFALTLMHQPGDIHIGEEEVALPRGLCRGASVTLPIRDVQHAYFLRRAVSWTRTAPVLVVETADRVFSYPRDWFRSDSDQRRVAAAINHRLGRLG